MIDRITQLDSANNVNSLPYSSFEGHSLINIQGYGFMVSLLTQIN